MKSKFLKKIIAVAVVGTSISTFISTSVFAVGSNDFYNWQSMNNGQNNFGWRQNNGNWYYYNYAGMMQTGWVYDNNKWYYIDSTGVMQTGVIQVKDKIYLFSESGAMQTGNAVVNGKYCTFDEYGVAVGDNIPAASKAFDISGANAVPYTSSQIITDEDSSPSDPNTEARDPNNLIKYNLKFKDDDGDEFSTKIVEKNEKITLYKPTKIGYTFVEWTTKKDGDGKSYDAGDKITITDDLTLYAQWEEATPNSGASTADNVLVEDIAVTSSTSLNTITTKAGTLQMNAKVLPVDATNSAVTWTVSNTAIATISSSGLLTAVANGTVSVVATANDTSKIVGRANITISGQTILGAAVTGLDGNLQMGATVTATAATTEAGAGTWTSSDPTVATVDGSTGVVTALKAGTTTIAYTTSTSGNVNSKSITVKAAAVVPGAAVTGLDNVDLQMGATITATAATTEAGAGTWTSSNPTVATVNASTGVVTALKAGTTTIAYTTSTSGNVNSKSITVKAAGVVPGAVITGLDGGLQMGATVTATAATTEAGAGNWKSSNQTVATVNANTGVVTALKAGTVTIAYTTSTSGNVNSKSITVKPAADNLPTAAPIISGTATVGQTLTATSGYADADGDVEAGTTYAFYRYDTDGTSNPVLVQAASATATYVIQAVDAGKVIKVKVVPKNAKGTGSEAVSAATATIAAITAVTSPVFTLVDTNNTVTITLTGGTFKTGAIAATDFTFAGTDATALAGGTFTRVSDTVVTITGLTGLTGTDNTVLVKSATEAKQASAVVAVASTN